jgi:hypothetical protein
MGVSKHQQVGFPATSPQAFGSRQIGQRPGSVSLMSEAISA